MAPKEYFQSPIWKTQAQIALPFLPTPNETILQIFDRLKDRNSLVGRKLVDLGAGDGRVVFSAVISYGMYATAIEINEELLQHMQERLKKLEETHPRIAKRIQILEADLFNFDVFDYDIIYVYPFPKCMKGFRHIWEQVKPEACLVSIRWPLDFLESEIAEDKVIKIKAIPPVWIYFKS